LVKTTNSIEIYKNITNNKKSTSKITTANKKSMDNRPKEKKEETGEEFDVQWEELNHDES